MVDWSGSEYPRHSSIRKLLILRAHHERGLQDITPFLSRFCPLGPSEPGLVTDSARYSLGIWDANDKSNAACLTVGYRVFVCDTMAVRATF